MPRTLTPEGLSALRAQLTFLRDLGIHDFYRRPASPAAEQGSTPSFSTVGFDAVLATGVQRPPETRRQPLQLTSNPPQPAQPSTPEDLLIATRKPAFSPPLILPGPPLSPEHKAAALAAIREQIGDCTRCPLAFQGRHTIVFGDGSPQARLFLVGEGPGADEDASGIPFVGKAGQLLDNMIVAMGLRREDVYIANVVKCRPPANRTPEAEEANTCTPFLFQQISAVRPEVIVALGSTAAAYLLGAKGPLSALRGRIHPAYSAKLIVTYHPAYLLRDPRQKKEAWADLQLAMRELAASSSKPKL